MLALRQRFTDRSHPDFVFRPAYHKRIPADGVAHYMESIWEQVLTNKDLDLPTQQELLAQFRCDEIAAVVVEAFLAAMKGVKRPVESGTVVEGLGGMLGDWRQTALCQSCCHGYKSTAYDLRPAAKFDKDASRYHPSVYSRKRADLVAGLHSAMTPLVLGQLKNLHKLAVSDFRKGLLERLKGDAYDFGSVVSEVGEQQEESFVASAQGGFDRRDSGLSADSSPTELMLKDADWQYEDELALLKEDLRLIADQLRADETRKMVNSIERSVKRQMADPIEVTLSKPKADMWDALLISYKETINKAKETYMAKAKSRCWTS